jgi:hypothetical protein
LIRVSTTLSNLSDGLVAASKCSNVTFITIHLLYEEMFIILYSQRDCLIHMLIDLNCILSVDCKPNMLIALT